MQRCRTARFLLAPLALVAPLALASSFAAPAQDATAQGPRRGEAEDTQLGGIMQRIRGGMRALRGQIESQDQAAEAKSDADRPAFVNAFRTKLVELLKASGDLETAVLASKFDEAEKVMREMLGPIQKSGHKQFRSD